MTVTEPTTTEPATTQEHGTGPADTTAAQHHDPHVVVVGVKTSGVRVATHVVVEVAWWDLTSGAHGSFVPAHNPRAVLAQADLDLMRKIRYLDRIAELASGDSWQDLHDLSVVARGSILVEVEPRFVATFLAEMYRSLDPDEHLGGLEWDDWLDLGTYAAGVIGAGNPRPLSLPELCERLDISPGDHTAAGDVAAAGTALSILQGLAAQRPAATPQTVLEQHLTAAAAGGAR